MLLRYLSMCRFDIGQGVSYAAVACCLIRMNGVRSGRISLWKCKSLLSAAFLAVHCHLSMKYSYGLMADGPASVRTPPLVSVDDP